MSKPRLLDLFCGAGGAGMGYHHAGFEVVGVDINPQPHYPFEFHQADALTYPLDGFDAVHASPPCQYNSWSARRWRNTGRRYPDLVVPTLTLLQAAGLPFICENVVGAPMLNRIILCGTMFGLGVIRHRLFVSSALLFSAGDCRHRGSVKSGAYVTVAGHGGDGSARFDLWCAAMGIDWMDKRELTQAIPPAYTEFLGRQLLAVLAQQEVA